jgi:HEAT repeat protein
MTSTGNAEKWLDELVRAAPARQRELAAQLLKTQQRYFDENEVSPEDRDKIAAMLFPLRAHVDADVRRAIATIVGMLRRSCEPALKVLGALMTDPDPSVQAIAVWGSGNAGTGAAPLVPTVLTLVDHHDREVRLRVPWALGEIRVFDAPVKTALLKLARDPDETVRLFAFEAIGACAPHVDPELIAVVRSGLTDKKVPAKVGACSVVWGVAGDWSSVKKDLEALFASGLPGERAQAALAICHCWPESVTNPEMNQWLRENQGFWWAVDLLAGKKV